LREAETELLAAHELSPRLRLQREFSRGWLGFSRVSPSGSLVASMIVPAVTVV
jgi:hypothetical protein